MASSDVNARERAVAAALARNQTPTSPPIPPRPSTLPASLTSPASPASAEHTLYSSSVDPLRSLIVFVVGAPGSGKTTQCAALARQFDCHHIVFDEYVKQAIHYAHNKAAKQRTDKQSAAAAALNGTAASSASLVSGFQPSLSSSQVSTLVRATTSASSTSSKQPIPSLLRSRLLYQAMQYLSVQQPLFRFLVDGYLDSEDDWNEWAALVQKRKAERDEATQGQDGKLGSQKTSSVTIGFLPPIILRLVCSESVGQLRWRRALLLQKDQLTSSTATLPSSGEVKARSMRYSLRTRPMIYRLGMVAEELMARKSAEVKAQADRVDEEEDDEDEDDLAAMDGMIVKRVDAEVPLEQCYSDLQQLMEQIVRNTRDDDWTRITGYDSDEEEDAMPAEAPAIAVSIATTTTTTATSTSTPAVPIESAVTIEPQVEVAEEQHIEESPSPDAVNWEEDPEEEKEREDREQEEKDRLERYERMLRLIEAEEEKWRLGLEREEAKERQRMEEEIAKLREREEEVAAEPGHIATRRDDRFTTFISFTVAVSLLLTSGQAAAGGSEREVWVEVYRGFEREERPGELRWVSVVKSAKLPVSGVGVAGLTVAFPRVIVNTWRLSGNEKERPVMFRLFASTPKLMSPTTASANAPKPTNPQLIGETRTILSHMLVPPEEKGLTLTLRRPPANNTPPSAYLVISPAALHTLLQPRKIVPPTRLHTVMADRPVIPAVIAVTPSNAVSREQSRETSPARQRELGRSVPITAQDGRTEEKQRDRDPRGRHTEEKEKERKKERGREKDKDRESRKRNKSASDLKTDNKQREKEEEEEMERMLREIDDQIGITTRRRAASFNAQVPVPLQLGGSAAVGASAGAGAAAQPAAAPVAAQPAPSTGRRSFVDEMKSSIGRLSIAATQRNNAKPAQRKPNKKDSKAEKERLQLLALRRKRKREEAVALRRRAESRERRRKELARIMRKAAVIKVSLLSVDCACMNLPVESRRQSLFSSKIEVKYYLQVYRKRDRVKEKERERKLREKRGSSVSQSVKVADMYASDVRNYSCHPEHRHLLKPSLFTLVYSSPLVSTAAPAFAPFLVPLDDQPLLFVVFAASGPRPSSSGSPSSATGGSAPSAANVFSSVECDGKDRIVGMSRLSVEDVVKMALIQQREWEVDVYGLVEREKEREQRREKKLREMDRRRERGESVDSQWEEEEDRMEEEKERAMSEKHRVSVRLRDPAAIEKDREARKAKRAEKKRAQSAAGPAAADDSDSDDSEGEESSEPVNASTVPLLSFFSLAFYSTRPVNKDAQQLVEYVPRQHRPSISSQAGSQVGGQASGRGSFTVKGSAPVSSAVTGGQ